MSFTTKMTIRELPKTRKMQVDEMNPLFKIQKNKFTVDEDERLAEIGTIYGAAMPMMLKYQRQILSQPERMPGLRSSFLSLQSNLGRLDKLDFEDVFNRDIIIHGPNAHQLYLRQFS